VIRKPDKALAWQSKAILLLVVPWTAASVILQAHWWITQVPVVAWTTLGISGIFGLIVWWMKAGTPAAAATGAAITASLMFSTTRYPYKYSWLHGGLMPLLAVFLLTFVATKIGKSKKDRLGTGESKRGRNAAQVAANLGASALAATLIPIFALDGILQRSFEAITAFLIVVPLAEAAADTISSEIGQVFGGLPRLITTLRKVEKGTDGGITPIGTLAGAAAALVVMIVGFWAIHGGQSILGSWMSICLGAACGVLGLIFDSLLGATLERQGWLNNDAVNFLSTLSSIVFAAGIMAVFALMM
jgi:uncharacterized protein (TIGR00297 family)